MKNVPAKDRKLPSYLESLYENSIKDLTSEDEKTKVRTQTYSPKDLMTAEELNL